MSSNLYLFSLVTTLIQVVETCLTNSVLAGVFASVCFALVTRSLVPSRKGSPGTVPYARGLTWILSWQFLARRHDFLTRHVTRLGQIFRFRFLDQDILVVSGAEWRKDFLTRKNFQLQEGYKILAGGVLPTVSSCKEDESTEDNAWISRRVIQIMHKDRLIRVLPRMCADIDQLMYGWGSRGIFDPFKDIYTMVFQLTARLSICSDIADDPVEVAHLTKLFWNAENNNTEWSILFPWIYRKTRQARMDAVMELYHKISARVDARRLADVKKEDSLQVLIDAGDSTHDIVEFSMNVLFAGVVNTAAMAAWIPYFLAENPHWKSKAVREIKSVLSKHSDPGSNSSLLSKLSSIPPEIWEEEMPVLDLCLRETIRLVYSAVLFRRNMGPSVHLHGQCIDSGDFIAYPPTDTHHDPRLFPDPLKFDPGRYARQGQTQASSFVGWGAGRHPCLGKRFAKLEVKVVTAMLVLRFDIELVDINSNPISKAPQPDRNNTIHPVTLGDKVFIKYTQIAIADL